jgi:DNA-directed RNA polymerase specialized sigma24 family protein
MRSAGDVTDDDNDRFTALMNQSAHRLYRVAYLLTGDRDQAEELTQSALVRTYTAWHRIRHGAGYLMIVIGTGRPCGTSRTARSPSG